MAIIQAQNPASALAKPVPATGEKPEAVRARAPLFWLLVTLGLLCASGGYRYWRDAQFQAMADQSATCPFPLSELPKTLGHWHAVEGSDSQLDPETARVAGSSDHIIRVYQSDDGEQVSVLLLYGLASNVFAHIPSYCYPAAGFKPITEPAPVDQNLSVSDVKDPVSYRLEYFTKTIAGMTRFDEVISTFRYNDVWMPEVASKWKMFRYRPGMFKIQTQRHVDALSPENVPTRELISNLVRYIENRIATRSGGAAAK